MPDRVIVDARTELASIRPTVYGHFAEHLGRCVYGGLWVGDDGAVEHADGLRRDTLSLLADVRTPVLRWPGGCFADDYHWEDGIGPREERPRRRNLWWTQGRANVREESNAFGTEEFLRLCREIDAEPYLAANVGSGSPDEAVNWFEYCNGEGETAYANRRRAHGRGDPHGVRYWGIGNENWACGGDYEPDAYAREYRRFANYLGRIGRDCEAVDPEFIACGHTTEDWNRRFLDSLGERLTPDHLSVHRYYRAGDAVDFSEEEYFRLFARAEQLGADVDRAAATIRASSQPDDIGIAVDEWGVWHPRAADDNGLEQPNTVRDALSAAGVLDGFNRRADVVTMANLAQTVNVLQCVVQTDEETAWPTPTYRVFELYEPHMGATAVRTAVETDVREVDDEAHDVPLVVASASTGPEGTYVTLSNRDLDERTVRLDVSRVAGSPVSGRLLFGDREPREHSTRETAGGFAPETLDLGAAPIVDLPPASVAGIRFA